MIQVSCGRNNIVSFCKYLDWRNILFGKLIDIRGEKLLKYVDAQFHISTYE